MHRERHRELMGTFPFYSLSTLVHESPVASEFCFRDPCVFLLC